MSPSKPKLLMLKGLPASGKSKYARELVDQGYTRVNKDDLRKMLHNGKWSKSNEAEVLNARDLIIMRNLQDRISVVVDDTNFAPAHQTELERIAEQYDADFEVMFIDTPLEECIKRNSKRADAVPLDVIYSMYNKYIATEVKKVEYNEELEECIIIDIDGTLAHITNGRSPYNALSSGDDSVDGVVSTIAAMHYKHGYKVIILSGRGKLQGEREITESWLADNDIPYDTLYTRPTGDERKDTVVKAELYDTYIKGQFNVRFIVDDRPSVCRMWRSKGLKVLQVGDPHVEF